MNIFGKIKKTLILIYHLRNPYQSANNVNIKYRKQEDIMKLEKN